jgi:hypothetical protein
MQADLNLRLSKHLMKKKHGGMGVHFHSFQPAITWRQIAMFTLRPFFHRRKLLGTYRRGNIMPPRYIWILRRKKHI